MKAYYEFHVDTAVAFGANRSSAEIEAKDVLDFEINLAKVKNFWNEISEILSETLNKFV